ncbi:MAG: chemotaxis protein CheA [Gammaproteobacteria bacterium]|nr:chemotaxis protein CheA [Gammaproteobacteria bacterium]
MNIDLNDEILQDFLIEGGEILEQLGEQLVELEQDPENSDLLNTVFRGFHTIKGGAGFVNLSSMVDICHGAEDVFNLLRQGQRQADSELMDAILQVLDILNDMFDRVRVGQEPPEADAALLAKLKVFADPQLSGAAGDSTMKQSVSDPIPVANPLSDGSTTQEAVGDTADLEFEGFLDELQTEASEPVSTSSSDDISDDEFESLLDQLHGKGAPGGAPESSQLPEEYLETERPDTNISRAKDQASDTISEDEFDDLIDELHGKGGAPGVSAAKSVSENTELKVTQVSEPKPQSVTMPPQPSPSADKVPAKVPVEATVRVDTRRLDDIMNLVGELVLARNRLAILYQARPDEEVTKAVSNLDMVTTGLQAAVMKTRMQPIKKVFGRFPRVVRNMARSLKKEIELEMRGEETDLDKNLVEALADPLVHLVRNAVDHGIELPQDRERIGKSRSGKIILSASQEGDHILLTIEDDGKGMDANVLRRKAVEKGLVDQETAERLSDSDAFNLIFMPGLSTKAKISDISGRGVGMDVVKTRIEELNGVIEIFSKKGKGSRIRIKVPLTLAILSTLMVVLGKQRFALPLSGVDEIFDFDPQDTSKVENQEVILVRKKALPVFYLRRWLIEDMDGMDSAVSSHVVVVHVGSHRVGFVVDQLIGQEEVVIKPLGAYLQGVLGFAGATITGDGRIALILDVVSLMKAKAGTL